MDKFKKAQAKEIAIGGYKCPCCTPLSNTDKNKAKRQLHKRARQRLKQDLLKEIQEYEEDNIDISF